jgi:hypothetical protein
LECNPRCKSCEGTVSQCAGCGDNREGLDCLCKVGKEKFKSKWIWK